MAVTPWLPLTDYSTKYKVSLSTLRRRIKSDDIKFRFDDGKYFISDEPLSTHPKLHRPSLNGAELTVSTHSGKSQEFTPSQNPTAADIASVASSLSQKANPEEPILTAASKLLAELKKAYMVILQEKEEQILNFREEISDLKTLVRVLESDNDRMRDLLKK